MKMDRILGHRHRMLGALAVGVSGVAMCAPAAHAATVKISTPIASVSIGTGSPATCAPTSTSQAFSRWGDANQYFLVPGGTFTSQTTGWTLTGGAKILDTNVPFDLGAGDVGALYLPPGSSATSPVMCVDAADPTYRLLGLGTGGLGALTSQAIYYTPVGVALPVTLAGTQLPTSWGPVAVAYTGAAPVSAVTGGTARMALHFTSTGMNLIDDVFVDPMMRGG